MTADRAAKDKQLRVGDRGRSGDHPQQRSAERIRSGRGQDVAGRGLVECPDQRHGVEGPSVRRPEALPDQGLLHGLGGGGAVWQQTYLTGQPVGPADQGVPDEEREVETVVQREVAEARRLAGHAEVPLGVPGQIDVALQQQPGAAEAGQDGAQPVQFGGGAPVRHPLPGGSAKGTRHRDGHHP